MDVTLRPSSDSFFERVVFPAFGLGAHQAGPVFEALLARVMDEGLRVQLELLLEHRSKDTFRGLDDERWFEVVYHLLFSEWTRDGEVWVPSEPTTAFVGGWDETLGLALMLEASDYPYADEPLAERALRSFWAKPRRDLGFSAMLCGVWDEARGFDPGEVLVSPGSNPMPALPGLVRSMWTWRPMVTVAQWAARLPSLLAKLLDREVKRLRPVEPPERHAILEYWLGRATEPPLLAVCFSGLGARSFDWIRQIGTLAQLIRATAASGRGLTAVLSSDGGPSTTLV